MHEFALMQTVLKLVEEKAQAHGLVRVTRVKLVVGKMTMALPAALELAFDALGRGTVAEGATLEIEEREVRLACPACGLEFSPELPHLGCPRCGETAPRLVQGRELYLDYFEGEDAG
ncbi:MAG: hydrogenase maturation nickel metallochaperone HypA [Clostridia bacterium]|nr:hydrogenase maturation nickel metallochaperone HypA [Clostridia bacterium]MBC7346559.1 hydrogenase maturation nickel metallochaperone HypA [Clostridia bacterium]